MAEAVVVVAERVATLPTPHVPSVRGACSSCGAPVWLSRASDADLRERPGSRVLCSVCAVAEMATDDGPHKVGVSDRTRAELEAYRRPGLTCDGCGAELEVGTVHDCPVLGTTVTIDPMEGGKHANANHAARGGRGR